ncbi:MAG TPA: class I SAM-dependent methyltransferase [Candidatus Marinimicrobia bacterium]|jgi:ubiquinone/menaquinone biosynthesis C-methylase UbiE|nr:class I SAM-dependent methyltransferase [Candidatus Neomarinimicrobiota bacterium]
MGTFFRKLAGFIFFFSKKIKHFLWKRIYDRLANTYEYFDWAFMNYGFDYDNKSNEPPLGDEDEEYRYCIQLYHHTVEKLAVQDKTVLEVGSGRGGGTSYIARYLSPKKITGIDYSKNAIKLCNRIHNEHNLRFVEGDASDLPIEDDSQDVVINVESSHCYPSIPQFLSEVKRVLKPGGLFAWTDVCPTEAVNDYEEAFNTCGMKTIDYYQITENVLRALDGDKINEVKNEIISKSTPFYLKGIIKDFSGMKDTAIYNTLKNGRTQYSFRILQNG